MVGRVALVTGANRGIGAEIARVLSELGAKVAINYPPGIVGASEEAENLSEELSTMNMIIPADVSKLDEVKAMVDRVTGELGPIRILVNNAGINRDNVMLRMKPEQWQSVIDVNLNGTFYCCQAVLRQMRKAGGGAIVNISSLMGISGNIGQANYCASKAGIIGLTKSNAREYAPLIRVNAVAPGYIDTEMTANFTDKEKQKWVSNIPLDRAGTAREVAHAVAFLASDDASYITGHVLTLDGGWIMP